MRWNRDERQKTEHKYSMDSLMELLKFGIYSLAGYLEGRGIQKYNVGHFLLENELVLNKTHGMAINPHFEM